MQRQKSFDNNAATLYLVPTPIGNLEEMTPRAIRLLQEVDVIACEDTRTTGKLLEHFSIHSKLIQHHNFNEEASAQGILQLLQEGKDVALVSDAGYPLINDPGQRIVTLATQQGYNVVPLSGCNAMLNGLVASGLVAQPFLFIGFLNQNKNEAIRQLQEYEDYPMTLIFYEAPHRIARTVGLCLEILGNRKACLARELTKRHEEFLRGTLEEISAECDALKGEMVLLVEGKKKEKPILDLADLTYMIDEQIEQGLSRTDAIKMVAKKTGISKNELYSFYHDNEKPN